MCNSKRIIYQDQLRHEVSRAVFSPISHPIIFRSFVATWHLSTLVFSEKGCRTTKLAWFCNHAILVDWYLTKVACRPSIVMKSRNDRISEHELLKKLYKRKRYHRLRENTALTDCSNYHKLKINTLFVTASNSWYFPRKYKAYSENFVDWNIIMRA